MKKSISMGSRAKGGQMVSEVVEVGVGGSIKDARAEGRRCHNGEWYSSYAAGRGAWRLVKKGIGPGLSGGGAGGSPFAVELEVQRVVLTDDKVVSADGLEISTGRVDPAHIDAFDGHGQRDVVAVEAIRAKLG